MQGPLKHLKRRFSYDPALLDARRNASPAKRPGNIMRVRTANSNHHFHGAPVLVQVFHYHCYAGNINAPIQKVNHFTKTSYYLHNTYLDGKDRRCYIDFVTDHQTTEDAMRPKRMRVDSLQRKLREGWVIVRLPGEKSLFNRPHRLPPFTVEMACPTETGIVWRWFAVTPRALELASQTALESARRYAEGLEH